MGQETRLERLVHTLLVSMDHSAALKSPNMEVYAGHLVSLALFIDRRIEYNALSEPPPPVSESNSDSLQPNDLSKAAGLLSDLFCDRRIDGKEFNLLSRCIHSVGRTYPKPFPTFDAEHVLMTRSQFGDYVSRALRESYHGFGDFEDMITACCASIEKQVRDERAKAG